MHNAGSLNLTARNWHCSKDHLNLRGLCRQCWGQHRRQSCSRCLESQAHAELNLALRKCRGETQRLARRERPAPVHVKRGIASDTCACDRAWCPNAETKANNVVHAGKVCMVGDVEALSDQLEIGLLAQLEAARDAHVEISIIGTESGIAPRAYGAVIRGMAIAVDVGPGQWVEGMARVISN